MRLTSLIKRGIQKLSFFMLGVSSRSGGQTSSSSRDALHSAKILRDHSVFRFVFTGTYPLQISSITFSTRLDSFICFFFFGDLKSGSSFSLFQQESYFQGQGQYCYAHAQMPLISMASEDKLVITPLSPRALSIHTQ